MVENDDEDDGLTIEERRAEQKERLGWTLARIRLQLKEVGSPIVGPLAPGSMKSLLHQLLDIDPADLIEVIENFPAHCATFEERNGRCRAEDEERDKKTRE